MSSNSNKTVIVKPIIFGNTSQAFPKAREEDGHTHAWTVYLKSYENEDMSVFIKKVQFKLHNSYAVPVRTITKPPYEVRETGWGEFDVEIKIFFADNVERTITLFHPLNFQQASEWYDELVFVNPSPVLAGCINNPRKFKQKFHNAPAHDFSDKEKEALEKIGAAQINIDKMMVETEADIEKKREQIKILKQALKKCQDIM